MRGYSDKEYIKIFRKMVGWEWYTEVNTFKLFMHCLIKANWTAGSWRGHHYERGQFFTSIASLSRETGLSIQQARTALKNLISTGELTSKNYPKYRVITVIAYDQYQGANNVDNNITTSKITSETTSDQQATNNRYKNNKNNKKDKKEKNIPAAPEGAPDDPWAWGGPKPTRWNEDDEWSWQNDQSNPNNPRMTRMEIWKFWGESDD